MSFLGKIKYMAFAANKARIVYEQFTKNDYESNRLLGEIVRYTHSIEKGLSLEKVRLGFGYAKIKDTMSYIERYEQLNNSLDAVQIRMFADALSDYIEFHSSHNYKTPQINDIIAIHNHLINKIGGHKGKYGGVLKVKRKECDNNHRELLKEIIMGRHSVREFEKTPVSDVDLRAAIELAMHCPSACNRQCYRVHIINKNEIHLLDGWLDGVGGFADDLDKMLLITGRISDYRPSEQMQYIVTPAVFAGYLTITLEVYNIGCCFIQRTLFPTREYTLIARRLSIPFDEQPICILGIGNFKKEYKVPVSHRLSYDQIVSSVL